MKMFWTILSLHCAQQNGHFKQHNGPRKALALLDIEKDAVSGINKSVDTFAKSHLIIAACYS